MKTSVFYKKCVSVLSALKYHLTIGVVWVYKALIDPKQSHDDIRRREYILNVLLVFSNIALWYLFATIIYNYFAQQPYRGINPLLFLSINIVATILIALSRKGYVNTATYGLLTLLYVGTTYGVITWGVHMQMNLLSYAMIIFMSFILLPTLYSFLYTITICSTIVLIWEMQLRGAIAVNTDWHNNFLSADVYEFSVIFLLIAIIAWLNKKEIDHSLARAHTSENNLRIERDLLEIRVEERTLEIKRVQAEKISELYRFAEFGRLSAGIFHDISSPLTALSVSVKKLQLEKSRTYHIETDLERISNASNKLGQLVSHVRKIFRQEKVLETVNLETCIKDISSLLRYRLIEHSVQLSINVPSDILLTTHQIRLQQIILNLLVNAIDSLQHYAIEQKTIHVSAQQDTINPSYIYVYVKDNGPGIPAQIVDKIFQPFFTTKGDCGTGIGLSQTKDMIEKEFNGSITVSSKPGNTIFTIHLIK